MGLIQRNWKSILLLLLGAVCIAIGIVRGEPDTVFTKAVNICLECIGIG